MASSRGMYLPDIGKCLAGDEILLSWDGLFKILLSHDSRSASSAISFFSDPLVRDLLLQRIPHFHPPSPQARASFDTKTAAINITPSASQSYDIDQIKSDALWLSQEVELDEIESLRLVVLEWQCEPKTRLRAGFSDAEVASLRDAVGLENQTLLDSGNGRAYNRPDEAFDSKDGRRCRQLSFYFQEQMYLLSVTKSILELGIIHSIVGSLVSPFTTIAEDYNSQIPSAHSLHEDVQGAVNFVQEKLQKLGVPRQWSVSEQHQSLLSDEYATFTLQSIATVLQILLLRIRGSKVRATSESLLTWLQFVASVEYFEILQSDIADQQASIELIRSAASCITVALLDSSSIISAMVDEHPASWSKAQEYFTDYDTFGEINDYMLAAADSGNVYASLGILAWGLVLLEIRQAASAAKEAREAHYVQRATDITNQDGLLGRRSSASSGSSAQQSIYEDLLDRMSSASFVDDAPTYLLKGAVEGYQVFQHISHLSTKVSLVDGVLSAVQLQIFQELLAVALPPLGYSPEIVSAELVILSSTPDLTREPNSVFDPPRAFIEDPYLMENFMDVATARFPYEALPFLRLCRVLAKAHVFDEDGTQYIAFRLQQLDSFTQAAIGGFTSYTTIREDENANLVSLEQAVGIVDLAKKNMLTYTTQTSDTIGIIPEDTVGEVISESTPAVIRWQHRFSGLALIGKWIELHYMGILATALSPFEAVEDVVLESIGLLTALLESTRANTTFAGNDEELRERCGSILDEASLLLKKDADIVSHIFELLEQELQPFRRRSPSANHSTILVACVDFLVVLSSIRPSQVWSGITKSSILDSNGAQGNLLTVISALEIPNQDFKLVRSCSSLYEVLLDLCLNPSSPGIASRKPNATKLNGSLQSASRRMTGSALLTFTETMYSAFEAIPGWTFTDSQQKASINASLARAFCKLLQFGFGTGDEYGLGTNLTVAYIPAAKFLVQSLRRANYSGVGICPILSGIVAGFIQDGNKMASRNEALIQVKPLLSLATILIRHGRLISEPLCTFDKQLFNFFPVLIRLAITDDLVAGECYVLARNILLATSISGASSLLGCLGSISSIAFLDCLKSASPISGDPELDYQVWQLLSVLVSHDQQWLAIILLTGIPPEHGRNKAQTQFMKARDPPFLQLALKEMTKMSSLQPLVALGILRFLVQAQQNWVSVTDALSSVPDFFSAVISWVTQPNSNSRGEVSQAVHNEIAALVTELATIHLHHVVAKRDAASVKSFIPLLNWLTSNAVEVASYNTSLHANLRKNISLKYNGLDVMDVKRTALVESQYGENFFYDIQFATQLLRGDPHWNNDKTGHQSFSSEFKRASINLSLVDSEMLLLESFKHLCVDHCAFFAKDREVQKTMAHVVTNCLNANTHAYPSETLFEALLQTRADLAVALIRQLVAVGARGSDFTALLNTSWNAARLRNGSYGLAIMNDDLKFWRSSLSVVLMSMHFHIGKKLKASYLGAFPGTSIAQIDAIHSTFLEIASSVIGEGLKSVVATLHAQKQAQSVSKTMAPTKDTLVEAKDTFLILNLLQTMLRLPRLSQFSTQLAECLISAGVGQTCLLLYSWSHLLTGGESKDAPVYADCSLRFLASLSSLSPVAEELAVEGTLNRILTSRITQTLQSVPHGASHVDKRPNAALLYSLWAGGMLPVCLNLLHAVGGGIAAEVSAFLNQFPSQLRRASLSFAISPQTRAEGGDVLTLGAASEAATLSLISFILASFREAGASAGVDPSKILPLSGFDEHRNALAEDVRDVLQQNQADRKRRTAALTEKEVMCQKSPDSNLDKQIVEQLRHALTCLQQEDEEERS